MFAMYSSNAKQACELQFYNSLPIKNKAYTPCASPLVLPANWVISIEAELPSSASAAANHTGIAASSGLAGYAISTAAKPVGMRHTKSELLHFKLALLGAHLSPYWQRPKQVLDGHSCAHTTRTSSAAGQLAVPVKLKPRGSSLCSSSSSSSEAAAAAKQQQQRSSSSSSEAAAAAAKQQQQLKTSTEGILAQVRASELSVTSTTSARTQFATKTT
jgi:hypothetical protein